MATFGDLKEKVLRLTGDLVDSVTELQEEQLLDAIIAAHDAVLPWAPKTSSTTFVGDGITTAFTLPSKFYDVDTIFDSDSGEILPQAVFSPGSHFGDSIQGTNTWVLRPSGSITFAKAIGSGSIYTMYYLTQWNAPTEATEDTEELEPPSYLDTAMIYFSAAYLMITPAIDAAEIRQWGTRVDSGNPEHNPVQKTVLFLLSLFNQEMSRIPSHIRAER